MSRNGFLRIFAPALLALLLTGGAYLWDRTRAETVETDQALRLSRQLATQVESMTLTAQERGEADPLNWTVSYLTQGVEPRVIRITTVATDATRAGTAEGGGDSFALDRMRGSFDYVKTILPEENRGVKIHLDVGVSGFLGSRTALGNDLLLTLTWTLLFLNFSMGLRRRDASQTGDESSAETAAPRERRLGVDALPDFAERPLPMGVPAAAAAEPVAAIAAPVATPSPLPIPEPTIIERVREVIVYRDELRPKITAWVGEAKGVLTQLGGHVRDVLKEAQIMAQAAKRSQSSIESLRKRLHGELEGIHSSRQALHEAQRAIMLAQAISIQTVTEAQRLGPQGRAVVRMAEQLDRLMKEVQKLNARGEKAVKGLEIELEPLIADADIAFESHNDVRRATTGLSERVDLAKTRLIQQAQMIQSLNQELKEAKQAAAEAKAASA